MAHSIDLRVYYEDTDAGGIVYYANYLRFAERGRTEFLRSLGYENRQLTDQCGILIVVKTVEIDYKKPAHLDDCLVLTTTIVKSGVTSLQMSQVFTRDGVEICALLVTLVCVATSHLRPTRWPEPLLTDLIKKDVK
jgi:tol-pal system-associated acyl-CoA thioesterase